MYVRIARFEGTEANWEERIVEVRNRMRGTSRDAAALDEVRTSIERALVLIDRERSRVLSLLFCDSEETLRDVDEAMSRMNPPAGGGTRASVEVYEVAVDERPFRAHQ